MPNAFTRRFRSDGFYVRVPSGKQFYSTSSKQLTAAMPCIGGTLKPFAEEDSTNASALLSPPHSV